MTRLEKIRNKLTELGLDGAIILNEINQHYLSGFAFTDGLLLITQNSAHLITDFRYYEMAHKCADEGYNIVTPENRTEYISSVISSDSVKTILLPVPFAFSIKLSKTLDINFLHK